MIEETAQVVAVEGDEAVLQTQRQSACHSCSVKKGCGTSVLAKVVGQRSNLIRVDNHLEAKPGDQVIVGVAEDALVKSSMLVYGLPLLLMLVSGLGGEQVAIAMGWATELAAMIFALAGFGLSLVLARLVLRYTSLRYRVQPRMLRIAAASASHHDMMLAP